MIFEEDNVEELEQSEILMGYGDSNDPLRAGDIVDIDIIISAQNANGVDEDTDIVLSWYESLW